MCSVLVSLRRESNISGIWMAGKCEIEPAKPANRTKSLRSATQPKTAIHPFRVYPLHKPEAAAAGAATSRPPFASPQLRC